MVQKLLCSDIQGVVVTQRTFANEPPIKIDVFLVPVGLKNAVDGDLDSPFRFELDSSLSLSPSICERPSYNKMHSNTAAASTAAKPKDCDTLPAFPQERSPPHIAVISTPNISLDIRNKSPATEIFVEEKSELLPLPPTSSHYCLFARAQVMNSFAIYDTVAIDSITGSQGDPPAWLEVEAVVVDESNFSTEEHWRRLQLVVTCPSTGKVSQSKISFTLKKSFNFNFVITCSIAN